MSETYRQEFVFYEFPCANAYLWKMCNRESQSSVKNSQISLLSIESGSCLGISFLSLWQAALTLWLGVEDSKVESSSPASDKTNLSVIWIIRVSLPMCTYDMKKICIETFAWICMLTNGRYAISYHAYDCGDWWIECLNAFVDCTYESLDGTGKTLNDLR